MKYIVLAALILSLFSVACNTADQETPKSENDVDAARNFIRSALDGKFNEARTFLFADSSNNQYFDVYERNYKKVNPDSARAYREATIKIHNVQAVNDSTTVVIYSNSFKNDHDTLKVLKKNNQWLVDLKYLFEHDSDTLFAKGSNKKDTLK